MTKRYKDLWIYKSSENMYSSHKQVGKTRVNKVRESLKTKKTHVQHKKNKVTGLDKLFLLQNELFKEGLNLNEYVEYLSDKVQSKKFYYRGLNSENIDALKKRYGDLIEKENLTYNLIGYEKEVSRRRNKQFREKKRKLIYEKKRELIGKLFKKMKSSRSLGVLKNTDILSDDPDKWVETKKHIFTGGRYIEAHDSEWTKIYKKIESNGVYHLFDLHSEHAMNQYVFEN